MAIQNSKNSLVLDKLKKNSEIQHKNPIIYSLGIDICTGFQLMVSGEIIFTRKTVIDKFGRKKIF